jgi:hypothetical protein
VAAVIQSPDMPRIARVLRERPTQVGEASPSRAEDHDPGYRGEETATLNSRTVVSCGMPTAPQMPDNRPPRYAWSRRSSRRRILLVHYPCDLRRVGRTQASNVTSLFRQPLHLTHVIEAIYSTRKQRRPQLVRSSQSPDK